MIRAVLALFLLTAATASAQTQDVEVEPVTCWWRTTATSVRIGEPFAVVLTCSLLQAEAARVVADESRLDPSVVQLQPFEVVGGARAKDLTTAGRRFIQFEYQLRVIAENVFASEVALPPLEVAYRIESRVAGGESLAGRDLTYALPSLTLRVLSLVPDTADDIREAPVSTFAELEGANSRASMLRAGAATLFALGALVAALGLVNLLRRRRAARPASERLMSRATVLGAVRGELASIQDAVRASGWTADLAGRALAAVRIVAAYASGRTVTQRSVAGIAAQGSSNVAQGSSRVAQGFSPATNTGGFSPATRDGEIVINGRAGAATVVSAAATTAADEELRDALAGLAAARYGREAKFDSRLDDAIATAMRRVDQLAADRPLLERLWPR